MIYQHFFGTIEIERIWTTTSLIHALFSNKNFSYFGGNNYMVGYKKKCRFSSRFSKKDKTLQVRQCIVFLIK